ncbi:phosphohydroxy-L-lysine phospho-lyase [Seminavis robusta]|uniref:Phosphohydroxy-L-lysine phospho-lyase n=1 Tax=Seminavis robusta TaxID=568900 RepID=A0A9N8EH00_9STRA|nr:phosphohydroxy-L-lysine phospho-lyase [Seminavis robusta]|eukprot:Sro934_g221870.1 phosphohydroxy-L-lysine phospho-lyase (516) ;mRNA; f:23486-25119
MMRSQALKIALGRTSRPGGQVGISHSMRRQLATGSGSTLGYEPNYSHMPKFEPKDNQSTPGVDTALHESSSWSTDALNTAIRDHSVFTWGPSDAIRKSCVLAKRAEGVYIYDQDDKQYLDWCAGAVCSNLGHSVPAEIQHAIQKQVQELPFVYGDFYVSEIRARLCHLLAQISPGSINGFLFASSGSEANEAAIRLARRYTGRHKIMSRSRSYHGGTSSALGITGDPRTWAVDATISGFVKIIDPFPFTFDWGSNEEEMVERSLGALHHQILTEGPQQIAAIVLESITGANGWMMTPPAYMQGVRALCDEYGILLVCDEVMTGFGRSGRMFGFQHFDGVLPDMYTFAKGTTAAFLPLSGVAMQDHVFDYFRENPTGYGSTYSAHPVCCAAAYATLQHILQIDLVEHVRSVEPVMKAGLERLVAKHPSVKAARTTGLGGGFDLAGKDGNFLIWMHETSPGLALFKQAMMDNGLVTLIRGHHVHCTPPLIITAEEIEEGIEKLDKSLDVLDEWIMAN